MAAVTRLRHERDRKLLTVDPRRDSELATASRAHAAGAVGRLDHGAGSGKQPMTDS